MATKKQNVVKLPESMRKEFEPVKASNPKPKPKTRTAPQKPPGTGLIPELERERATKTEQPAAPARDTVKVNKQVYQDMQKRAARNQRPKRDQLLDAAITAGKIAEDRRSVYAKMYDADPAGTERLLTASVDEGGLMPGQVAGTSTGAARWQQVEGTGLIRELNR